MLNSAISKKLKNKPSVFYQSYWLTKLMNKLAQRGRKASVEKIFFRVFKKIKIKFDKNALKIIFHILIKNRPVLGFFPIRISREIKKIPFPLSPRRQLILSMNWLVTTLKLIRYRRKNITMEQVLYEQLKAALSKEKTLLTNRPITHMKELIQNRVNLHFRRKLKK